MPEGYTHVRTARKAAETIHYKIQCPAAFAAGANGPDSFFCFEIWKKRAKRRYDLPGLGNRMHEEKTGAFLRSLCANVKTRPQVEYTLGFLSHYAADTVVHPFICAMCAPGQPYAGKGGHGYLEIALDSTLHAEDTGSALVPVDDVSPAHRGGAGRHHGAAAHLSAGNLRRRHPRGVPGRCVLAHLQAARAVPQ